jgi:GTPase SAR1 family protein
MLSDFLRLIKGFILFIGPSEAGKTSILRRLVTGQFEDYEPTLGFREENIAKVRVIEIGGQESFRKYWDTAINQKPARIFYVIDISKESDFQEYQEFVKEYPNASNGTILTANKVDLVENLPKEITEIEEAIICSAKSNEGMLEILEAIASMRNKAEYKGRNTLSITEKKVDDEEDSEEVESILKEFEGKF